MSLSFLSQQASACVADWQAKQAPLMTRWASDVSSQNPLPEYPRPQMMRERWVNLNGLWDYAIASQSAASPAETGAFEGQILVPFPVESALSGVMKRMGDDERLWYRRVVQTPHMNSGERLLLHFGAVDWHASVWVNGRFVGEHKGGYDPFSFDITDALSDREGQEIVVCVSDPTDAGTQPRGKQIREPHRIWYVPVTGIWQTVWLEPVPVAHIQRLKIVPDIDNDRVRVTVEGSGAAQGWQVKLVAADPDSGRRVTAAGRVGDEIDIDLKEPMLWSPDSPFLYNLTAELVAEGGQNGSARVDVVESYFGMRKISLGKDDKGILRILLNNKFVFQYGPLDQGYWPDGLYTAPTDEALRFDLEMTKRLGFNMSRKHVKVEPARWYYWADKLGVLVWQDMPSGDKIAGRWGTEIERTEESAEQFELEYRRMIDAFHNHPSIVVWVPFNESWGQYDTARIAEWTKQYDPTRLVDSISGWIDMGVGDMRDYHVYPGPSSPKPEATRAAVLGEFGGLGLPIEEHLWQEQANWGYRTYETRLALAKAYLTQMRQLAPLINSPGLSAAVYTQLTDVEIEVNGLLTYDREVLKIEPALVHSVHHEMICSPPEVSVIVSTALQEGTDWQYTFESPNDRWNTLGFDASGWKIGKSGFGLKGRKSASHIGTVWDESADEIWIRREFELTPEQLENLRDPRLLLHWDNHARVYLNGQLIQKVEDFSKAYTLFDLNEAARQALRPGKNLIAVHCVQVSGLRYIDAGLIDVRGNAPADISIGGESTRIHETRHPQRKRESAAAHPAGTR